jgi:hypothetical protein
MAALVINGAYTLGLESNKNTPPSESHGKRLAIVSGTSKNGILMLFPLVFLAETNSNKKYIALAKIPTAPTDRLATPLMVRT